MPITNELHTVVIDNLAGGIRPDYEEISLDADELAVGRDVSFYGRGIVGGRPTWKNYVTLGFDVTQVEYLDVDEDGEALRVYFLDSSNGPRWQAPGSNTVQIVPTTFTAPSDFDDYAVGAAAWDGQAYITSIRSASAAIWTSGSWTTRTFSDFDGSSSRFPSAKHLAVHHDLMFAANVNSTTDGRKPGRLRWSNPLDPETWDAEDYIDFGVGDGSGITAIVPFGEDLVVFRRRGIDILSGRSAASFTRYSVSTNLGTRSPKTVHVIGELLVFFDDAHGVFAFDGSGFAELSEGISEEIRFNAFDGAYAAAHAAAFVQDDQYFLSVGGYPGGTYYNSRTYVWNRRFDAWAEWSFGFADAGYLPGDRYTSIKPVAATLAYREWGTIKTGTTTVVDDLLYLNSDMSPSASSGQYVYARYATPWVQLAPAGQEARIRRIITKWEYSGDWTLYSSLPVTVGARKDLVSLYQDDTTVYGNYFAEDTLSLPLRQTSVGASYVGPRTMHTHDHYGFGNERLNHVQIEITQDMETYAHQPAKLRSVEIVYSVQPRGKGTVDV